MTILNKIRDGLLENKKEIGQILCKENVCYSLSKEIGTYIISVSSTVTKVIGERDIRNELNYADQ